MTFSKIIAQIKEVNGNRDFTPLHEPCFSGNEKKYLADTIDTTFVSSVGAYVDRFEIEMAKYTGTAKSTSVVNGTAALQVAIRLAGVGDHTEVLTQALSFVATANAIAYNFAKPVFIDVDLDTMGMSPKALSRFLEEYGDLREDGCYNKSTGNKIVACVPMHTFGFMCRIDKVVSICNDWKIVVVEDAAEALGSKYKGQSAGSFGQTGAFSFNGNKIITAGGGGAIVSRDASIAERAKYLTTTAKVAHKWEYVHDELGYNFRMPNVNAALACAQLERIEDIINAKRLLLYSYNQIFSVDTVKLKPIPDDTDWNHWMISVELENLDQRDLFLSETNGVGVMTRPIWKLISSLPMYKECQRDDLKNSIWLEQRIVNVPSSVKV
ncbi:MAG: aminotransferase in exopolysaccharide biosynthesis [Roseivirga sp.]|jgi:perosamine synthetase